MKGREAPPAVDFFQTSSFILHNFPLRSIKTLTPGALAALLMLLTVAAYIPAMGAGYIWDDDTLLTANPQMRSAEGLGEIWRGEHSRDYTPVTLTSFWVEWRLWGKNPAGYHVVNILLHGGSAVLVWMVLARLGVPGAWLGAALFAVHPVNVASVAWIAERKNTLSGAFFFGAVLCYLMARDGRRAGVYMGSLGLFLLAALSKGAVVTLPAVLLLCVWWKERKVTRRDVAGVVPYALIAMAAAVLTVRFQARAQHYGLLPDTLDYRVARAGMAIWYYLGALAWPGGMSPMRGPWVANPRAPLTYAPALAAAGMLALFYWKRRGWGRPLLFAYGYYLTMLLPVLGFVWMTLMQETPSADWWQYMAAPGIFACAAAGAATAARRWRVVTPLACAWVALLMIRTWQRGAIYESMESYCAAVTAEDPHAWTIQNNLGIMLKRRGRFAESEACFRQALRDNPGYVEAHINLGNTMGAAGNPAGEEAEFRQAEAMRPGDPEILDDLAGLYAAEGRMEEALASEREAVKAGPGNVPRLFRYGEMLAGRGRFAEAEGCFREAVGIAPNLVGPRFELCQALMAQGKRDAALEQCGEVERIARESGQADLIDAAAKLRRHCEGAPGAK
jgi:tetratricopeptide (TPR) repeat protein